MSILFADFAGDVRKLAAALARVLRRDDPYDVAAVDCPDCEAPLRMDYAKPDPCPPSCPHNGAGHDQGGRRDHWHCSDRRCGRIVEAAEYWLAVRAKLEGAS